MKKPLLQQLLLLAMCMLAAFQARATHIVGGEISYKPFPNDPTSYYVTAKLYRDYGNTSVDYSGQVNLYCRKSSCITGTLADFTANLTRVSRTVTSYSTDIQVFTGSIRLPSAGTWTLSLAQENRSFGILNLSNSGNFGMYVDAELLHDPAIGKANTSPVFTSEVLPFISGNQFHRFSFSAFDADGDSLVYKLISPQGASELYPCPQTLPVVASPHFSINAATGELPTVPFTLNQGYYLVAARVEEYRRVSGQWAKIGSVMRDIMYRAVASSNRNPTFTGLTRGNTALTLDQPIRVNPGRKIELTLAATDQDAGAVLRFSSEAATSLPGVSLQALPNSQTRLTWEVPATLPLGRYRLPVTVADNGTPINGTEVLTLTFLVTDQVLASTTARPLYLPASPNPFRSQVSFKLSNPQTVTITDGLGRLVERVSSRPDGVVTWQPAASVMPGLYFARTADGQQLVRLVRE